MIAPATGHRQKRTGASDTPVSLAPAVVYPTELPNPAPTQELSTHTGGEEPLEGTAGKTRPPPISSSFSRQLDREHTDHLPRLGSLSRDASLRA